MAITCSFLNAPFGDCFALVDEPLRQEENLHGLLFALQPPESDGVPVYHWTGRRVEWTQQRTFKSRGERTGKRQPLEMEVD